MAVMLMTALLAFHVIKVATRETAEQSQTTSILSVEYLVGLIFT